MAQISQTVLVNNPPLSGLSLRGRGKVRDTYDLPGHPDKMLVVASDRISIFDFVLSAFIGMKGAVLAALNHFWTREVLSAISETDMIACGAGIDEYLPENWRGEPELQKRATVVKKLSAPTVEDIVRLYLTGSGWESYQKIGSVCGHRLPTGLQNGSRLPFPIYTPTTKAEVGHDEHISADSVARQFGHLRERLAIQCACAIAAYAEKRGIILADTKFEFSGETLADEKGTPDSSRFWDLEEWRKAQAKGKLPPAFDKQYVRNWGIGEGVNKRDPENPADLAYVHGLDVPKDIRKMTTRIYRYIFWRLTGHCIETYQREELGISIPVSRRKVEVLIGSKSDSPQILAGLERLKGRADVRVQVMSCHRNPAELLDFARSTQADVVIAGAGKAAALPGIVKSWLCHFGKPEIPVIGVAFGGATAKDNQAAIESIESLPGQPVELDSDGCAYFGNDGFGRACEIAIQAEFLPKAIEAKPVEVVDEFS